MERIPQPRGEEGSRYAAERECTHIAVRGPGGEAVELLVVENRVAMIRECQGASLAILSLLTGIDLLTLRSIEHGITRPTPAQAVVLHLVLGASMRFLFPAKLPDRFGATY